MMTPLFIGGLGMQGVLLITCRTTTTVFRREEDSRTDERFRQESTFVQGGDE